MKPHENLTNFFNEFNNLSSDQNNDENIINCKYCGIIEIQTLSKLNIKCTMSPFHINSCSFSKNIKDLEHLLNSASINFDVISIGETRIVKDKTPINSLNLINYIHEFYFAKSSAGGVILCIRNHFSYKPRKDLCNYKAVELDSSCIEISNPKRSNIITGYIYRHQSMDLDEFSNNYLNILFDKLSKENKYFFLLVHFNVDLLKYNKHTPTDKFLDSLLHMFLPHIVQAARISTTLKTLIDNLFFKYSFSQFYLR